MNSYLFVLVFLISSVLATEHIPAESSLTYTLYNNTRYNVAIKILEGEYANIVIYDGSNTIVDGTYFEIVRVLSTTNNSGYVKITNNFIFTDIDAEVKISNIDALNIELFIIIIVCSLVFLCCLCCVSMIVIKSWCCSKSKIEYKNDIELESIDFEDI